MESRRKEDKRWCEEEEMGSEALSSDHQLTIFCHIIPTSKTLPFKPTFELFPSPTHIKHALYHLDPSILTQSWKPLLTSTILPRTVAISASCSAFIPLLHGSIRKRRELKRSQLHALYNCSFHAEVFITLIESVIIEQPVEYH